MDTKLNFVDCTLRDGGYYNAWDFSDDFIKEYLLSMDAVGADVVELGFRSLVNDGFKGVSAYTTDDFLRTLKIPTRLTVGVMINASELMVADEIEAKLSCLFPVSANESAVDLVRVACHVHEFEHALLAATWLKGHDYLVGINIMQIASRSESDIKKLAKDAVQYPIDVLYFADSLGSLTPEKTAQIICWLRSEWKGALGIHAHNNLGLALTNTLCALDEGVTWLDVTVSGMGRGPGNACTEELAIEIAERRNNTLNLVPLMTMIRRHFDPMRATYHWGSNPFYYLAGKFGIHPTYVQEMISDARYDDEDILAVIGYLRLEGGDIFSWNMLDAARHFYHGEPGGNWRPESLIKEREVLLLGTGPGILKHKKAIEQFIHNRNPIVIALNTLSNIKTELVDLRIACHPVRLLADCSAHMALPQPLITPYSMFPENIHQALKDKEILDYGIHVKSDVFAFGMNYCTVPSSLVIAYALAVATSGKSSRVYLAGFDGYQGEDPRNFETNKLFKQYQRENAAVDIVAITPTRYDVPVKSVYGEFI